MPLSKTYSPSDFREGRTAQAASRLRRFALQLGLSGSPFAVNGILKRRFWVRRNKLWEYARGLAFLESAYGVRRVSAAGGPANVSSRGEPRREETLGRLASDDPAAASAATEASGASLRSPGNGGTDVPHSARVLDFGGAGTLPVFYLASLGYDVLCLDIDAALAEFTNEVASRRGWKLRASAHNLVTSPAPAEWGLFDAVISFSVLEHITKAEQAPLAARLAALLKPGGVLAVTFDFGADAPQPDALRTLEEVAQLVAASGLSYADGQALQDTGERFVLDKRHSKSCFTFGSVFLRKQH